MNNSVIPNAATAATHPPVSAFDPSDRWSGETDDAFRRRCDYRVLPGETIWQAGDRVDPVRTFTDEADDVPAEVKATVQATMDGWAAERDLEWNGPSFVRRQVLRAAAAEVLAEVARRRGFAACQPAWVDDPSDPAVAVMVDCDGALLDAPPDLEAAMAFCDDLAEDLQDRHAQARAADAATRSGIPALSLRHAAETLVAVAQPITARLNLRQRPVLTAGAFDVLMAAVPRLLLGAPEVAQTVERAEPQAELAEAKPTGRLRFQTEETWDAKLDWHFAGLLPVHGLGLIFAEPGAGKSLLATLMAYCTATGAPFAGRATRPGRVLFSCPDSPSSTKRRLAALSPEARRRIVVVPEISLPDDAEELATWLQTEAAKGDPVRLLVVDTWDSARQMPGAGWAQEDKSILECTRILREIAERLRIAVVLIHHSTKNQEAPTARGSAALRGRLEWEGHLRRVADGVVQLTTSKARDGEMGVVGSWRIVAEPHPADGEPTPRLEYIDSALEAAGAVAGAKAAKAVARERRLESDRRKVLLGLAAAPDACRTKASLAAAVGMPATPWYRVVKALRDEGYVTSRNFYLSPAGQAAVEGMQEEGAGG